MQSAHLAAHRGRLHVVEIFTVFPEGNDLNHNWNVFSNMVQRTEHLPNEENRLVQASEEKSLGGYDSSLPIPELSNDRFC